MQAADATRTGGQQHSLMRPPVLIPRAAVGNSLRERKGETLHALLPARHLLAYPAEIWPRSSRACGT